MLNIRSDMHVKLDEMLEKTCREALITLEQENDISLGSDGRMASFEGSVASFVHSCIGSRPSVLIHVEEV